MNKTLNLAQRQEGRRSRGKLGLTYHPAYFDVDRVITTSWFVRVQCYCLVEIIWCYNIQLEIKFAYNLINRYVKKIKLNLNQLHAVSRTQQGRQRNLSVKTLRSLLFAELRRHCVRHWEAKLNANVKEIKILKRRREFSSRPNFQNIVCWRMELNALLSHYL